jgi:4,5-DOPA dioxygenase extradiol
MANQLVSCSFAYTPGTAERAGLVTLQFAVQALLRYLWPQADVPVLPLAFVPTWSPAQLFDFGTALAPLAERDVLVIGSGSITHNLRRVFSGGGADVDAAEVTESAAFRDWFVQRSAAREWPALFDYRRQAPHAHDMHPSDEHLLPWFVAAGAGGLDAAPRRLHDSVSYGCLGMDLYAFGARAPMLALRLSQPPAG